MLTKCQEHDGGYAEGACWHCDLETGAAYLKAVKLEAGYYAVPCGDYWLLTTAAKLAGISYFDKDNTKRISILAMDELFAHAKSLPRWWNPSQQEVWRVQLSDHCMYHADGRKLRGWTKERVGVDLATGKEVLA